MQQFEVSCDAVEERGFVQEDRQVGCDVGRR